ncbi:MAG TPA: hypothetical protein VK742_03650 [Candidatus Sulfotelmatobacter sp.]|jgi:hypothetical protein|nr:hypothetical protein [Candidatus Sulfotelmatobacter sp.]
MDADERDIYHYLQTFGEQFVHAKEIARRAAGKKRFGTEPEWAREPLSRMADRGLVETDMQSRFRLRPDKDHKKGKWIAPDINKILADGGVHVEGAINIEEPTE